MINNLKVGADPELFFEKDGKPFSVEGLIKGTKENPRELNKKGCALQEDNVMAEFNIPECDNKNDFNENIEYALDNLQTIALLNDCELLIEPSANFENKFLKSKQSLEFGCSPDNNAYTFSQNDRVEILENVRVAGGHIHIGYDNPSEDLNLAIVRTLDIFLGLPSILLDKDTVRRKYYGHAGSYRNKSYGVEYRTLSNFWIKNKENREWVFDQIKKAIDFINSGAIRNISEDLWNKIELAINDNDASLSLSLENEINNLIKVQVNE